MGETGLLEGERERDLIAECSQRSRAITRACCVRFIMMSKRLYSKRVRTRSNVILFISRPEFITLVPTRPFATHCVITKIYAALRFSNCILFTFSCVRDVPMPTDTLPTADLQITNLQRSYDLCNL